MEKTTSQPLPETTSEAYLWQALHLFNLYRVALAVTFLILTHLNIKLNLLGSINYLLFKQTSIIYLISSSLFLIWSLFWKKHYAWQANLPIFMDILAIIIIMHSCGGILSGMGLLLIIVAAAHGLLSPGKLSYLGAATAIISLIGEHTYTFFTQNHAINLYTQVGLLGTAILITSGVTSLLSLRARKTQLKLDTQSRQLATSQQLNAHIISAMHAGVLVFDTQQKIHLMNTAAVHLLSVSNTRPLQFLQDLPLPFQEAFQEWQEHARYVNPRQMTLTSPEVRFTFHPLGEGLPAGTLVFIYDVAQEKQQAQILKLTSLAHLTANIAHELRNPLGAASHATQLLAESLDLTEEEMQLFKMIKQSCDRMNTVIKNVLSLSGRQPAKTQEIELIPWLEQFIKEISLPAIPHPNIILQYPRRDIFINVDPSQLTQILINLCENGLRYSLEKNNQATITLRVQIEGTFLYIDIIDQGKGIPSNIAQHIFEPFFTTEKTGSGLGLYIAKELTQMNGARLDYFPRTGGCQFRITLSQGGPLA